MLWCLSCSFKTGNKVLFNVAKAGRPTQLSDVAIALQPLSKRHQRSLWKGSRTPSSPLLHPSLSNASTWSPTRLVQNSGRWVASLTRDCQCSGQQLGSKDEKEAARDTRSKTWAHAPQGFDWPEPWTEGVRCGEDRLVAEDHPPPLKPLRPKSTERVGYQSLSLPRTFSPLWHKQTGQISELYKQR